MSNVFVVFHTRIKDEDNDDVKLIGVFASQQQAETAVRQVKDQSGFKDHPDGFSIGQYALDELYWQDGFGID